MKKPRKT